MGVIRAADPAPFSTRRPTVYGRVPSLTLAVSLVMGVDHQNVSYFGDVFDESSTFFVRGGGVEETCDTVPCTA